MTTHSDTQGSQQQLSQLSQSQAVINSQHHASNLDINNESPFQRTQTIPQQSLTNLNHATNTTNPSSTYHSSLRHPHHISIPSKSNSDTHKRIPHPRKLWFSILGDWKGSLKFIGTATVIVTILFLITFSTGYYPKAEHAFDYRGWTEGFFISRMPFAAYIVFFVFFWNPLQELIFRGILLEALLRTRIDPFISIFISALLFGFVRVFFYPAPTGIVMSAFLMGLIFGRDYHRHRSLVTLSIFHTLWASMAITVNLW